MLGPVNQFRLFFSFLALFCLCLFFLPKFNLIRFENETAGIRVDDFVLASFGFFVVCLSIYQKKTHFNSLELLLAGIVCSSAVSFLLNRLFVNEGLVVVDAKIFYVLRILEYFLFFYIGGFLAEKYCLKKILTLFVSVNLLLMLLQKEGIITQLTGVGGSVVDTVRVSGVASFPSEMGALLSMIFTYFLFQPAKQNSRFAGIPRACMLLLFYFPLTLLTGARIALAAILALFFFFLIRNLRWHQFAFLGTAIAMVIGLPFYYLIEQTAGVSERSAGLVSQTNLDMISEIWDETEVHTSLYDNIPMVDPLYDIGVIDIDYDLSWWIRIHKWCYAWKVYLHEPLMYLFGVGPGAFSAALDGGFLRVLTELGLVGAFFYCAFFYELSKISPTVRWVIIAFLFNMIFFDIYLAYKAMTLLFLIAGWENHLKKNPQSIN